MNRWLKRLSVLPVAMPLWAAAATAHPHVWITMHTEVLFNEQGLITGLHERWQFDKSYTAAAIEGMDKDGDGRLSDAELAPVTENNLAVLKDYDYFTIAHHAGTLLKLGPVGAYGQDFSGGLLEMHFNLPFQHPVDPRSGPFTVKFYDPDFFVDLEYAKAQPFGVKGAMPAACAAALKPVPSTAELEQTRAMLASKGVDWKPENGEDFGSMFAQALEVSCQP